MPDTSLPVLIVNGLGAPRMAARAYGRVFRERGHRVYTAPQRLLGYGDIRVAADLVAEAIDDTLQRSGADKLKLVGMSLGGLIGLYHLTTSQDAKRVERFVSVGGPLNGSEAARLAGRPRTGLVHAIAQMHPDSDLIQVVRSAARPPGVRLFTVGAPGDVMTPRGAWDAAGFEVVESPHGVFPIGHWSLFLHPANQQLVADVLERE